MLVVVAARDEADRIAATLAGLAGAFPGAAVWVADDGSSDATAAIARAAGASVLDATAKASRCRRAFGGKGQAMTLGVGAAVADVCSEKACSKKADAARAYARAHTHVTADLEIDPEGPAEPVLVLCDGDLGRSASELGPLVDAVRVGEADLAIAAFSTRQGGGFGLALAFARWAVRRRCGLSQRAPLSGQRALRVGALEGLVPFAPGYGMEIGMTIDAVRAGHRVVEIELALSHRPTGRGPAGFVHRGRQLADCIRVYVSRSHAGSHARQHGTK